MTRLVIVPTEKSSGKSNRPNLLRQAKLKRTKFVILSEAKDPDALHRAHTAYPFQPQIKNQLRQAKLKRTKFVILSEAEGPAFLSSHYASSGSQQSGCRRLQNVDHCKVVILSEEKDPQASEPNDSVPGSAHGCPRFAQLTWVSLKARSFKGWQ